MKGIKRLSVLLLMFIASSSYAWWEAGHMLVADIAYTNLKDPAKKTVNELLPYMKSEDTQNHKYTFDKNNPNYTLMAVSHWPDDIKSYPNYLSLYSTWHYIEHAYTDDGTDIPSIIPRDNVVGAISQFKRHLGLNKANAYSRARALSFLVHFVGDIHQPLHCGEYYSKLVPNGDRGGNSYKISYIEKNGAQLKNLHALWDSALTLFPSKGFSHEVSAPKDIHTIASLITLDYPESYFSDKAKDMDPAKWEIESHTLAMDAHQLPFDSIPNDAYLNLNTQLAEQRIVLAGYRLANLLNQLLK
tara:strand:- start:779 stop:1681 length:903 start_codon:yes stop_codon:yes gene_type:complete